MSLEFAALVAAVTVAPVLGGLPTVLGRSVDERMLHTSIGVAAGLMVGIAFLRIIPRTIEAGGAATGLTLGAAFVVLYVLEGLAGVHGHTAHEHDHGHEPGDHFAQATRTPALALAALSIHMFLDGLILAPAFAVEEALGWATGLAVTAHKIPAGFATGTILAAAGVSGARGVLGVAAVAATTALGALVGLALTGVAGLVPHLLAVAGATLLFVAVAELLPELHHGPHKGRVVGGLVVGFAAVAVLGRLLAALGAGG